MADKVLMGANPLRYHLQLTETETPDALMEGMDNMDILLAVPMRGICWGRRAFGVFKSNHTGTKCVTYIKDFGFYLQQCASQIKCKVTYSYLNFRKVTLDCMEARLEAREVGEECGSPRARTMAERMEGSGLV